MTMGGEGPWAITTMWAVTVLTLVCVLLRAYTRIVVVQSYGIDDHVYTLAFILLVCYTATTTVSAHYGFGQNMWDIPVPDDLVNAILFEAIGQTFAVVGMAVAKWSLGLFLLRLVTQTWHKVLIWIAMASLMAASISVCFVFWLQCTPPAYLWDRRIPGGYCHINTTPVSFTLCILCVVVDFFFSFFPWLFLWNLNMNQREKMIIAISMSLGFIAGACGIKRTIEVPALSSENYLKDTVGLIVWSAAEIAVTMICIGIPVCRPLYKRFLDRLLSKGNSGYQKQGASNGPRFGLRTFGGSAMPNRWESNADGKSQVSHTTSGTDNGPGGSGANNGSFTDVKLGINGPFTETRAMAGRVAPDNHSDEEILGEEFRRSQVRGSDPERGMTSGGNAAIQVTEEWRVTRS
ncbi:hypothetical protein QBC46DRAFT_127916 [Diplogelasinospora grovesii]|uniref:Rhodopsin domain-containing protein n=1 Tax=Diplogelasinospora grovesii TaxID=303347 RepID=A0AAN6S4M6_9PEZI|nr:hypothetical protein QBC46DRAFT_127916 [Diplogelasinospora grovesii]